MLIKLFVIRSRSRGLNYAVCIVQQTSLLHIFLKRLFEIVLRFGFIFLTLYFILLLDKKVFAGIF